MVNALQRRVAEWGTTVMCARHRLWVDLGARAARPKEGTACQKMNGLGGANDFYSMGTLCIVRIVCRVTSGLSVDLRRGLITTRTVEIGICDKCIEA